MRLFREPLLHFLLIGAAFFALYAWLNPDALESDRRIVVDEGRINALSESFQRTWRRVPTHGEIASLVDDFALEEIYYRQALALGLDEDDPVIRRRLQQKLEFLAVSMATATQPDESELQSYLEAHPDQYRRPDRYSFEQIYINPARPAAELEQRLAEVATALGNGQVVDGDQTLIAREFSDASTSRIDNTLGNDFSKQLDDLALNEWSPPLRSGLGFHFIRLTARLPGEVPAIGDVREQVLRDWSYDNENTIKRRVEKELLADYKIVVEWPEEAGSQ
ncbi:MAG: peptidylprolyl isomerase [Gammaproteobacteria bacterium]